VTAHKPVLPPKQQPSEQQPSARKIAFEPVQLRVRHDGWTADKQIRFIEALAGSKCVDEACRQVGMSDTSAYRLRNRPCGAAFRRAWDAALDCQVHRLEQAFIDRAINGVPRPIFYKGEQVGEWRYFDERAAMFVLRHRRPHRYGKWMDRLLAPQLGLDSGPEGCCGDDAIGLDGGLEEIGLKAPSSIGNPEVDWANPENDCDDREPKPEGDGAE
jgi:hypothetical protein